MIEVPLSSRKRHRMVALVDAGDYDAVSQYSWHLAPRGDQVYAAAVVNGKLVYMHRFIMGSGPDEIVDHVDRHGLNNSRTNLRHVTRAENNTNVGKKKSRITPYKGVGMVKGKYPYAYININGRKKYLGSFPTVVEAARAYDRYAELHHGDFAVTNESLGLFDDNKEVVNA